MKNNQEDKDFSYEVKIISGSSFLTKCYLLSSERKKLIGEAYFKKILKVSGKLELMLKMTKDSETTV